MNAWLSLVGTLAGAVIALGGVYFTTRAADQRDRRNRLWDKRAEVFVDAVQFLYDVRRYDPPLTAEEPDPHDYFQTMSRLAARIAVFADREVEEAFLTASKPSGWEDYYGQRKSRPSWTYEHLVVFEELVYHRLHGSRKGSPVYDSVYEVPEATQPWWRTSRWLAPWADREASARATRTTPASTSSQGYYSSSAGDSDEGAESR